MPAEDTPTAATTPAASIPAAATSAATRYPDHHRHAGTGQPHPRHSATATGPLVTPYLPQPRPPPRPHRSPYTPALKPQVNGPRTPPTPMCMASTRAHALAHAGWFTHWPLLCRVAQHQPNKYRSKTIQKPSNNHTTTVQQPYKNCPKTGTTTACKNAPARRAEHSDTKRKTQDHKGGAGATPRHTALRRGEGGRRPTRRAAPTPTGPQGRRRRHPSSPCATARRGRPEAYPKGRPHRQKSDPAPPEIGRGSKRALTHRAGKSNRLM